MDWLKRNLTWVVAGVVALVLLAGSGFYLYSRLQAQGDVSAKLTAQLEECKKLQNAKPYPNETNIEAAKKDLQRVESLKTDYEKFFTPFDYPEVTSGLEFKRVLDNTLDQLYRQAKDANVKVQTNYAFSFEGQRYATQFQADSQKLLVQRLTEVQALCRVLFDAKVLSLERIQRVSVGKDDTVAQDLIRVKEQTNSLAVVTPYQVIFTAYTPQLADVINGLAQSPHCFLITAMNITTNLSLEQSEFVPGQPGYGYPGAGDSSTAARDTAMALRYGLQSRYGPEGGGGGAAARYAMRYGMNPNAAARYGTPMTPGLPIRPKGPEVIASEVPLKVTLQVDLLKLKPADEGQQPALVQR